MTDEAVQPSSTFRIFVSSTFSDLKAERDALQRYVFPRLRELCARHGGRFQAIDLRWGVSEEAGLDQRTMPICLGEIERCQKTTPRPNFLVLLGDRYGWRPLPPDIPKDEFDRISDKVTDATNKELLETWYRLDKNAVDPPVYSLEPRRLELPKKASKKAREAAQDAEAAEWADTESRLRQILLGAIATLDLDEDARLKYEASATEQEIVDGALSVADAPEHVFCFFRKLETSGGAPLTERAPEDGKARDFVDQVKSDGLFVLDGEAQERLEQLKEEKLRRRLGDNVHDYEAPWVGETLEKCLSLLGEAKASGGLPEPLDACLSLLEEARKRDEEEARKYQTAMKLERLPEAFEKCLVLLKEAAALAPLSEGLNECLQSLEQASETIGSLPEPEPGADPEAALDACLALLDDPKAKPSLCLDVWRSLASIILRQLAQIAQVDPLYAEIWEHEEFGRERRRHFIGRTQPLAQISEYLDGSEQNAFAILGSPGSGKSALMAKAFEDACAAHSDANVFIRFIGATAASSDGRSLLDSLCRQISRAYETDTADIPSEYNELAVELGKRLALATEEKPLILFLDALDQLSGVGRSLSWLPGSLPEHVHVVASTLPGDCERALRAKHPAPEIYELELMGKDEGEELLGKWLEEAKRTLQTPQRDEVLDKFALDGHPLYLRLAYEEARLWRSFADPNETVLAEGIPDLIRENLFKRLALASNHGKVMVAHSLGYLAASRYGLSEDEIVDVLSLDEEVKSDFREHARRSPDTPRLPIVVWSRLYFDLEPYLTERSAEGTTLLAFYHNQLRYAARDAYLEKPHLERRHTALAAYFRDRSDPAGDRTWTGAYARGLSELPFHLAEAGELDELYETLTDFKFLEHKAAEVAVAEHTGADGETTKTYAGVFQLQDDYELALDKLGGGSAAARKPLIVTGVDFGDGMVIRCPWCNTMSPFQEEWRGRGADIACPNEKCKGPLRVNKFVVGESMFEMG